jgi:hypothetical protein
VETSGAKKPACKSAALPWFEAVWKLLLHRNPSGTKKPACKKDDLLWFATAWKLLSDETGMVQKQWQGVSGMAADGMEGAVG